MLQLSSVILELRGSRVEPLEGNEVCCVCCSVSITSCAVVD